VVGDSGGDLLFSPPPPVFTRFEECSSFCVDEWWWWGWEEGDGERFVAPFISFLFFSFLVCSCTGSARVLVDVCVCV